VRADTLFTADGTEIVKSFGLKRKIIVPLKVEILRKSSFESWEHVTEVKLEGGSKLRKICRSALSGCDSLRTIVVPASVTEIEEFAFKACIGLEDCSIPEDSILVRIGREVFAGCSSLRPFYIPKKVEGIGRTVSTNVLLYFG
jgi:hypothetical protein